MRSYSGLSIKYIKHNKSEFLTILIPIILTVMILITSAILGRYYVDKDFQDVIKREGYYDARLVNLDINNVNKLKDSKLIDNYAVGCSYGISTLETMEPEFGDYKFRYNQVELYGVDYKIFEEDFLNYKLSEGRMPTNKNEVLITKSTIKNLGRVDRSVSIGSELSIDFEVNRNSEDYREFDITKNNYITLAGSVTQDNKWEYKDISIDGNIVGVEKGTPIIESKKLKIVGVLEVSSDSILWRNKLITINDNSKTSDYEVLVNLKKEGTEDELAKELGIKYVERRIPTTLTGFDEGQTMGEVGSQVKYPNYHKNNYKVGVLTNPKTGVFLTFTIIFAIAAIFTAFNIVLNKKIKYLGIMRAIGATKWQVAKILLIENLIIAILGIPIGVLLGMGIVKVQIILSKVLFNIDLTSIRFAIDASWLGSCLLVIMSILALVIIKAIAKEQKLSPIEAIRNTDITIKDEELSSKDLQSYVEQDRKKLLYKVLSKFFNIEGELAYKNLNRNFKRNLFGIITLAGGLILIQCFIFQFINIKIKGDFKLESSHWNYKLQALGNGYNQNDLEEISKVDGVNKVYKDLTTVAEAIVEKSNVNELLVEDFAGIEDVEKIKEMPISLKVRGIDDASLDILNDSISGNKVLKEDLDKDGVILVNKWISFSERTNPGGEVTTFNEINPVLRYKINDEIEITCNRNIKKLKVLGYVDKDVLVDNMNMMNKENFTESGCVIVSENVFKELNGSNVVSRAFIDIKEGSERKATIDNINTKYGDRTNGIDSYVEKEQLELQNKKDLLWNGIFMFNITIMILVSMTNIIVANVLSRKKELAALRAIGMENEQRNKMIICESFVIAINAGVAAFVGGIILLSFQVGNISQGKTSLIFNFMLTLIVVSVGISLATILGRMAVNRINKMNITDLLKNE